MLKRIAVILLATALLAPPSPAPAQRHVTTPREALGFDIGADYHLATYTQFEAYWRTLARQSPRMVLREIGKTAEGRTQLMAIITTPENHKRIARYQEIARRLARAEGLTDEQAHALAAEGRAVVWIDGGLHATEVLGAHQLMELVYQMVSRDDPETRRFLNDVILLAVQANPDGMELVSSWYMREPDSLKRSTAGVPRLYQKYIGHDNNPRPRKGNHPGHRNRPRVIFRGGVPPDRVYPPPAGPRRRRAVRPAVPGSFQLLLRPARADRHRHGRGSDARPLPRGGQAGRHDALGRAVFDVVERRASHHRLFPQHHRAPHGVDRQSDADRHPVRPRPRAAQGRPALTRRAAKVALPAVGRVLDHRQPCRARLRLALPRDAALQHLPHGDECHRARQHGPLYHAPPA